MLLLISALVLILPTYGFIVSNSNSNLTSVSDVMTKDIYKGSFSLIGSATVNSTAELNLTLEPIVDAPNTSIEIILPEGIKLVNGNLTWREDLKQGKKFEINVSIMPTEGGASLISAWIENEKLEGFNRYYFIDINVTGGNIPAYKLVYETTLIKIEENLNKFVQLNYSKNISNPLPSASIASISGQINYLDLQNSPHPVRKAVIGIANAADTILSVTNTDLNGYFTFSNVDISTYNQLHFWVFTDTEFSDTDAGEVTNANGVTYGFRVPTTGSKTISPGSNNLGTLPSIPLNLAWNAYDHLVTVYKWFSDTTGYANPRVTLQFPSGNWPSACRQTIYLPTITDYDSVGQYQVIYHEFAHTVMYSVYSPLSGCNFETTCGYPPHNFYSKTCEGAAIIEGWAEFIQAAVENDPTKASDWDVCSSGTNKNIEDNNWYRGPDCDTGTYQGNIIEGAAASIWWDIFDSNNHPLDPDLDLLYKGFAPIFDIIKTYQPESINDFRAYWIQNYGSETAINEIYASHGVSSLPNRPSEPVGPSQGITKTSYKYSTSVVDPNGYQVRYIFDWGDGTTTSVSLVDSGTIVNAPHSWSNAGTYNIRAMAVNSQSAYSVLSDPLAVSLVSANKPTVTNGIGATLVTSNSARLNGELTDTGGDNPEVHIYFGIADGGTNQNSWEASKNFGKLGLGTFYWDISSLTPGTRYYYRCYATNSAGSSWASSTAQFDTPPAISKPTVTNGVGWELVTANSARLNGEIANTGGENPAVHICWGTTDGVTTQANWQNDQSMGVLGTGTFYKDISGLTPGTQYYYRCYATNSAGTSWASSTATFTTGSGDYTPTVTNDGAASGIEASVATVGAQITNTGGANPELHIVWGTSDGDTNPSSWQHNENLGTNAIGTYYRDLSPLTPGTPYYYRCYATNSAGTGWASSTATFTTLQNSDARNVALRAVNGQYLCAEGSGGGAVVANRNAIGGWETFKLIDRGNGYYALQAANGQYLCAEGGGGDGVVANRNVIGGWETFKLIDRGNGNVALQAANGQYLCAEGGGGDGVVANRNAIGGWETFKLIDRGNGYYALQAANGQYLCAEGGGGDGVVANRNAIGGWETFKLIPR